MERETKAKDAAKDVSVVAGMKRDVEELREKIESMKGSTVDCDGAYALETHARRIVSNIERVQELEHIIQTVEIAFAQDQNGIRG